jgi:hypothetical protein
VLGYFNKPPSCSRREMEVQSYYFMQAAEFYYAGNLVESTLRNLPLNMCVSVSVC